MKILWITKRPVNNGSSGEEVYDRKLIAACRDINSRIDLFHPDPVGRASEVANMLRGVPYQRARYAASVNRRGLHDRARNYDFAVCSWEPFDSLARSLPIPTLLIVHNISSMALPGIFPGNPLANLAALRARVWEKTSYTSGHYFSVGALSRNDLHYLNNIGAPRPTWLPPGMPPCTQLHYDAQFRADLVVSGTYLWGPKRRGVVQFASEYRASGAPYAIMADALPSDVTPLLAARPLPTDSGDALRIGIVTDRFDAGHKLKTLAYIAENQIVMSFANVSFDFDDIPDHAFFIRRVTSVADIVQNVKQLENVAPDALRQRFLMFQRRCAERFTWQSTARSLIDIGDSINPMKVVA